VRRQELLRIEVYKLNSRSPQN